MTRDEIEREIDLVRARMEQVGKGSRAYRAGEIILVSLQNTLAAMERGAYDD